MEVLTDLPYRFEAEQVLSRAKAKQKKQHLETVEKLLEQVDGILSPRVLYRTAYIDQKKEKALVIEGLTFTSRILRVNLDPVERVFPYIITCGEAFERFAASREDLLETYFLDEIGNLALGRVQEAFLGFLKDKYLLEEVGRMSPGSLEDWPLEEQRPLFALFGGGRVKELLGVELNEQLMMHPQKSLSGMAFASKTGFKSCRLCPRESCPGRRAPYDEAMLQRYLS